jgi:serine/threonine-protein kinase
MEEDPSALPAGTLLAGKFRVVRCLGAGGMGSVYEIEHELTKHRRALKMLHAAMANIPGVVERFLREASAAGRVGNPHIVETFDAGTLEGGEPYIVMEMLKGCPLTDKIGQGPMSISDVVDLIGQACDGVQAAHEAGIVHRDLKPDNLFIADQDGRPFVKILDFGISKFDPGKTGGMALTQEGAALGTPYYMSPEQIRGEMGLDARADVYALGVILYECFAGQRPFDADSLTHLAVLIHTGNPKPLLEHRPDLPQGIADVVSRAMATDRNNRIQSAQDLKNELAKFGAIAFRSTQAAMPPAQPVLPTPPLSAMGTPGLATSAAGVSVAQARSQVTQAGQKSQRNVIIAGFAALAVVAVVGAVLVRGGGEPAPEASSSVTATKLVDPPRAASPAPPALPAPEPVVTAPAPSASATAAAPSAIATPRPGAPSPAAAPKGPLAQPAAAQPAAPPKPASSGAKRTEQKGLAKENPFL